MILHALLSIPYAVIWSFLFLLPDDAGTYASISSAFSYVVAQANAWSYILPVSDLLAVLTIIVTIELAVLTWRLFNWVLSVLPDWLSGR